MEQPKVISKHSPLPGAEWKVLKVIRIDSGGDWPFMGYLLYSRPYESSNLVQNQDNLDVAILKNIQRYYPYSVLEKSVAINMEGDLEDQLKKYKREKETLMEMIFCPINPLDSNVSYLSRFDFHNTERLLLLKGKVVTKAFPVWHNASDKEFSRFIYKEILLEFDLGEIEQLATSISSVHAV
jgi:hypothetical protein